MAEESGQERTESATAKRREDFREKGQVAQSKEVTTAALMCLSLILWLFYAPMFWSDTEDLVASILRTMGTAEVTPLFVIEMAWNLSLRTLLLLLPIFLISMLTGFFSSYLQVGPLFTTKPFVPDLSKFDPIKGMGRFVSKRSAVELVKSLAKVVLIGFVAYLTVRGEFEQALSLVDMEPVKTLSFLGKTLYLVMIKICFIMILLGFADFAYAKWEMEQKMKMTKQEQKEEYKNAEGDPAIKARIRALQQQMSRKRMMEAVPKADVIVTNPTHLSVALSYVRDKMDAPQVVAKGAGHMALRIRELAKKNRVPLVENKPVARALYQVEIGHPVPEELYTAVAEVLAYVYSLKGKRT